MLLLLMLIQEEASRRNAARPPGQHIPPAVLSKLAAALELPPAAADMAGGGPAAGGGAGWEANTVWVTPDMRCGWERGDMSRHIIMSSDLTKPGVVDVLSDKPALPWMWQNTKGDYERQFDGSCALFLAAVAVSAAPGPSAFLQAYCWQG